VNIHKRARDGSSTTFTTSGVGCMTNARQQEKDTAAEKSVHNIAKKIQEQIAAEDEKEKEGNKESRAESKLRLILKKGVDVRIALSGAGEGDQSSMLRLCDRLARIVLANQTTTFLAPGGKEVTAQLGEAIGVSSIQLCFEFLFNNMLGDTALRRISSLTNPSNDFGAYSNIEFLDGLASCSSIHIHIHCLHFDNSSTIIVLSSQRNDNCFTLSQCRLCR